MKKIVKIVNDNYIRYMNDEHNNRYRYMDIECIQKYIKRSDEMARQELNNVYNRYKDSIIKSGYYVYYKYNRKKLPKELLNLILN